MNYEQMKEVRELLRDRLKIVRQKSTRTDTVQQRHAADINDQIYRAIVNSHGVTVDELLLKFDLPRESIRKRVTAALKSGLLTKGKDGHKTVYFGRGN